MRVETELGDWREGEPCAPAPLMELPELVRASSAGSTAGESSPVPRARGEPCEATPPEHAAARATASASGALRLDFSAAGADDECPAPDQVPEQVAVRLAEADETVRIPTRGFIPSYNVQAATSMLLGEWLRQTEPFA